MKVSCLVFTFLLIWCSMAASPSARASSRSGLLPIEGAPGAGFWKSKSEWKAYWVQDWVVKKVYVPIWKRVWGPTEKKEWVPTGVAKPPPGIKRSIIAH